jgi:hypothetical protein
MSKNPWIKRKKDKDDGWEYLEHGFKIKHTDRGRPMIFQPKGEEDNGQPHNPGFCRWRSTTADGIVVQDWRQDFGHTDEECGIGMPASEVDGCFKKYPERDASKDWDIEGVWDGFSQVARVGYSVPEGGIDE